MARTTPERHVFDTFCQWFGMGFGFKNFGEARMPQSDLTGDERFSRGATVWTKADREPVYFKRLDGLKPDRLGQTGRRSM